jgi:hypothetical protein
LSSKVNCWLHHALVILPEPLLASSGLMSVADAVHAQRATCGVLNTAYAGMLSAPLASAYPPAP